MAPNTTPPAPGNLTVPLLFGWEGIVTLLVLLIVVAVAFFVISAGGAPTSERSEWQASLDARSRKRPDPATDGGRSARLDDDLAQGPALADVSKGRGDLVE